MTVPAVVPDEVPVLDLDRLDVYRATVQFCAVVSRLRVTPASLRDQIDRASASVVLTLAEGIGRVSGPDRAHFFAMARGSAFECAAVLDLLHARGSLPTAAHADSRRLLVRVVQMLTRLIDRQRYAITAGGGQAWALSSIVCICTTRTTRARAARPSAGVATPRPRSTSRMAADSIADPRAME
jgi:four helix bundle protein